MNATELLQFSFGNAFGILGQVTADLTQKQADWTPPGVANPIGATYWHAVSSADQIVHGWCAGQAPLMESAGWGEKVLLASGSAGERESLEHMRSIRVNLPVLNEYAEAVAGAVQVWLATLNPEDLDEKKQTPIGELAVGQMLETFVIWHLNAHCGEIAALKGCLGARGYPF